MFVMQGGAISTRESRLYRVGSLEQIIMYILTGEPAHMFRAKVNEGH